MGDKLRLLSWVFHFFVVSRNLAPSVTMAILQLIADDRRSVFPYDPRRSQNFLRSAIRDPRSSAIIWKPALSSNLSAIKFYDNRDVPRNVVADKINALKLYAAEIKQAFSSHSDMRCSAGCKDVRAKRFYSIDFFHTSILIHNELLVSETRKK